MRLFWSMVDRFLGPLLMLRRVWPWLAALALLIAAAAAVFKHYNPGFGLIDSAYAAVATITTLGDYGTDMTRMQPLEKVLLMTIILLSVAFAATAIQEIVSTLVQREYWQEALATLRVKRMRRHAVVIGGGSCAREIAKKLANLGVAYSVVVPESAPEHVVAAFAPAPVLKGELKHTHVLLEAGVDHARQVEIAVDDDALALVVTMNVRQLKKDARIIVNADDDELTQHFKTAGANLVLASSRVIGRMMAIAAVTENVAGMIFSDVAGLQKEIGVFNVAEGSFAAGKTIEESGVHKLVWILGVVRAGTFNWEMGRASQLVAKDELVVLGDASSFAQLRQLLVPARLMSARDDG